MIIRFLQGCLTSSVITLVSAVYFDANNYLLLVLILLFFMWLYLLIMALLGR